MKKFWNILRKVLIGIGAVLLFVFVWILANEYVPMAYEELEITTDGDTSYIRQGQELSVLTWNIGYCGLGKDADFFMDGGKSVTSADENTVLENMLDIKKFIRDQNPDLIMLQEVDTNSERTYHINETKYLAASESVHALNYSCVYVPYPIPPIGQVNSGLFTTTNLYISSAERVALPCPFSWPVSAANLKRCLLVSYLPIKGTNSLCL